MPAFRIEVDGDELRCSFPHDQLVQDDLTDRFGAQWHPASKGAPGAWVVPIDAESEVLSIAERAGYEAEIV